MSSYRITKYDVLVYLCISSIILKRIDINNTPDILSTVLRIPDRSITRAVFYRIHRVSLRTFMCVFPWCLSFWKRVPFLVHGAIYDVECYQAFH